METQQHVVVTVHGIRTFGHWQPRLADLVRKQDKNAIIYNYVYGYFSILAFLIPPLRWIVTRKFKMELMRVSCHHPGARLDIVGHSFGTHLIGWGLARMRAPDIPKIHTIILSGSVLVRGFNWGRLLNQGHVRRLVNDCGIHDSILILNQLTVLFTGMAGRLGLDGMTSDAFSNRYFRGGHSLYFEREGKPSDEFMERYWVPILLQDGPIERVDERTTPTFMDGIKTTVLQNVEPIKLTIYALILATPAIVYATLYRDAMTQRVIAEQALKQARRSELNANNARVVADQRRQAILETLVWVFNETAEYPVDMYILGGAKNDLMEGLLKRLKSSGYTGGIELSGHIGNPIVVRSGDDIAISPCIWQGTKRFSKLDRMGYGQEYSFALGQKLAESARRSAVRVGFNERDLEAISFGIEKPRVPYPEHLTEKSLLTAADCAAWNGAAIRNNHVSIKLVPR